MVTGHNGNQGVHIRFRELGADDLCNLLRCMGSGIIHALLQRIGKRLNGVGMLFYIALFSRKSCVWHITGSFAQRGNHEAIAFFLQCRGMGLKFNGEIALTAGKGSSRGAEVDALVNGKVL